MPVLNLGRRSINPNKKIFNMKNQGIQLHDEKFDNLNNEINAFLYADL